MVDTRPRKYRLYWNGNCCKGGTEISKIIAGAEVEARAVSLRKPTGFSRASVTASLLCFGCFAVGQHVNGCFFASVDVFFYPPA